MTPFDVVNLRYYTEYQWLVDFSLYASIVYVISEIYHFFIPLKEEVNLSMMWCLLVIFFALLVFTWISIGSGVSSINFHPPISCFAVNYWYHWLCNISKVMNQLESGRHALLRVWYTYWLRWLCWLSMKIRWRLA